MIERLGAVALDKGEDVVLGDHPFELVIGERVFRAKLMFQEVYCPANSFHVNAVFASKLPESVPGTSVDRQCGSSQQAVHFAAQGVMSGTQELVVAGGLQNMSAIPISAAMLVADQYGFTTPFAESPGWLARYGDVQVSQFRSAEMIAGPRTGISRPALRSTHSPARWSFLFSTQRRLTAFQRALLRGRWPSARRGRSRSWWPSGAPRVVRLVVSEGHREHWLPRAQCLRQRSDAALVHDRGCPRHEQRVRSFGHRENAGWERPRDSSHEQSGRRGRRGVQS